MLVRKLGVENDMGSRVDASSVSNPELIGGEEDSMKSVSSNVQCLFTRTTTIVG